MVIPRSFAAGTRVTLKDGIFSSLDVHLIRVEHRMQTGDVRAGGGMGTHYSKL